jgi:amidophosphoribosyltransferase
MGGFFGAVSKRDVTLDVFFGVDYHSHLGTRRAGMVVYDEKDGFDRQIHSIENTPFRTKFENDLARFHGTSAIGCISDADPQPLLVHSHLGTFAITTIGAINNADALIEECFAQGNNQFMALSTGGVNATELVAALINQKDTLVEGITYAQEKVDGSLTLLIMTDNGELIAARDSMGRLPVLVGKDDNGHCVAFESFAYQKLGYHDVYELGSAEIVRLTATDIEVLSPAREEMKICAFMWVYYGYPNSNYEGQNVEVMRYRNGAIMARDEAERGVLPEVFRMPLGLPPNRSSLSGVPSLSTRLPGRALSCLPTKKFATRWQK